jgi:putative membrane protein insertion efficiency factor
VEKKMSFLRKLPTYAVIFLLRIYKRGVSPFLPQLCRYDPTCSEYMAGAIAKYGLFKGSILGIARILRCNPLFDGGSDPVPKTFRFPFLLRHDNKENS